MEIQLKIAGIILICLALVHLFFPRYFEWKQELQRLSLVNRQMVQVHTFFIALTLFLMGLLAFFFGRDLMATTLGQAIGLGLGVFWVIRLVVQFIGYSSQLWKGKAFETFIHILFITLWSYLSFIFFNIYFHWL
ncbi:MAG: hypothetical protein EOO05_09900 [Chitinophagaceae bacterium]|nr:MAG: hypothetical protein EOO05_09900 [Chitinophagaceae bacterium]